MPEDSGTVVLERVADEIETLIDSNDAEEPYGYLQQAWTGIHSLVKGLRGSLQDSRREDAHACFWLLFLRRYDQLTRDIRKEIDDERLSAEEITEHLSEVRKWLTDEVTPMITQSKSAGTFRRDPSSGLLHSKSAYRLFAALESMKPEMIMEYEPLIFEIPSRVMKLLPDQVQTRGA